MLLDTHALLWFALASPSLSGSAKDRLEQAMFSGTVVFLCAASFWELAVKIKKQKLNIGMSALDFETRCRATEGFEIIDTSAKHWIGSAELEWEHRDPIDRLLVFTAKEYSIPIVTRDETIRRYYAECIW